MTRTAMGALLGHLRKIVDPAHGPSVSDGELLERFVRQRDEAAFELLVWRHQRMVLGVCRRVLRDVHDAEDAFQAAFLALARKAASVNRRHVVAGWLHTVAFRIALRLRASRRKKMDIDWASLASPGDAAEEAVRRDLAAVLDEEVSRLPTKYRVPVVLCYLEGKSYAEAGRQLGLAIGTLAGRLNRARVLLRKRLIRRGIDACGAVLAAVLCEQASSAAAPAALVNAAVKASSTAGTPSTTAAALAEGALRSLFLGKVKVATAVLLAGFLIVGMGLLIPAALIAPIAVKEPPSAAPPAESKEKPVRLDDHGDPLPAGAIRRLGTLRFRHGGGTIHNLLLTPDGETLVSNDYYGSRKVCVWELATGKLLRRFPGTYEQKDIALSHDGKLVAIGQKKAIVLWDLISGKEVRRLAQPDATGFAFSPDGKILAAAGSYPGIHLWNLTTGKKNTQFVWERNRTSVTLLSFTPDGKTLIAGQRFDSAIGLWDVASGKKRKELDAKAGDIFSFALSPDGAMLATGSRQGGIPLWDVKTGQLIRKLRPEGGKECTAVAFSPDGKTLAAIESNANGRDFLSLWDVATGKELPRFKGDISFWNVVFSRDSKTLIAGWGSTIRLWDVATGKEVGPAAGSPGFAGLATLAPDGRTLAYRCDKDLRFWDMAAGREIGSLTDLPQGITPFAFAPDSKTLTVAAGEHAVNLWDVKSRKLLRRLQWDKKESPYSYWASAVAFSPDGRILASADAKGIQAYIRLWDPATGKQIRRLTMNDPGAPENRWIDTYSVTFSPDGKILAASGRTWDEGSKVRIWEVATGKELSHLTRTMNVPAKGDKPLSLDDFERKLIFSKVVFSPDGRMLAKNGRPKTIPVWETATGQQRLLLEGHEESTICVAFAPDGRTLASASWDETIRLWDLDTGRQLRKLTGHRGNADSLTFSADGRTLVSTGDDTTVLFWDVADVIRRERPRAPLTAPQWQACWAALMEANAAKAYAAMIRMTADGPTTVAALKERLRPTRPVNAERLTRLLKDLDDDQFVVREKAAGELEKVAELARPALEQALADPGVSLDRRRRLEALLASIAEISGERLRALRAIEVLERLNTAEARELLKALAAGAPEALTTTAAEAALKRRGR